MTWKKKMSADYIFQFEQRKYSSKQQLFKLQKMTAIALQRRASSIKIDQ